MQRRRGGLTRARAACAGCSASRRGPCTAACRCPAQPHTAMTLSGTRAPGAGQDGGKEGRTSSISRTFFFSSLYFAWYLASSRPATMPGAICLCARPREEAAEGACEGPGDGWCDMAVAGRAGVGCQRAGIIASGDMCCTPPNELPGRRAWTARRLLRPGFELISENLGLRFPGSRWPSEVQCSAIYHYGYGIFTTIHISGYAKQAPGSGKPKSLLIDHPIYFGLNLRRQRAMRCETGKVARRQLIGAFPLLCRTRP